MEDESYSIPSIYLYKYSEYSENNSSASLTIIDNATCDGTDRNDCDTET